jgi:hypothetical protein
MRALPDWRQDLLTLLDRVSKGTGTDADIATMKQLSTAMQRASLCGLGQTTPNPVLSIIRHFEDELNDHIQNRHCPAGKCAALVRFDIDAKPVSGVRSVRENAQSTVSPVSASSHM